MTFPKAIYKKQNFQLIKGNQGKKEEEKLSCGKTYIIINILYTL